MKNEKKTINIHHNYINEEINSKEIRLIGINGEQLGIMNTYKALKKAKELNLDLIEINKKSIPPICKIMNYGKFLYKKNKQIKEQKKKQKIIKIKEIKLHTNTDENDYQIKLGNLIRFINNKKKIKITICFRGREIKYKKIGLEILDRIKNDLKNITTIETYPNRIEGRKMIMILIPKKIK